MNVLDTSLMWRNLGIATIPILAGSKKPALESWKQWSEELPPVSRLKAWFAVDYSLAVILGWRNLAVIDFDDEERWESWQADHDPIDTYRVKTSRGWHLYVYTEEETSTWRGENIDVKGKSSYVLTPPSIHPSGHRYQGYGSPHQIATIASVTELLPEYEQAPVWQPRERKPYDPFEEAMREHEPCGISIEAIKAAWSWKDVIPVNGKARRGVTMTNCPFHNDEHASLAIYPDGHAHCFGNCDFHGDVVDAYAQLHKLTVQEAIREMAR